MNFWTFLLQLLRPDAPAPWQAIRAARKQRRHSSGDHSRGVPDERDANAPRRWTLRRHRPYPSLQSSSRRKDRVKNCKLISFSS